MKTTEALEALERAVADIAGEANIAGFKTEIRSKYADVDSAELTENSPEARIICTDLTVSLDGAEESMIYQCVLTINEGECSVEEMSSEVGAMRASVRELVAKVGKAEDKLAAFNAELEETDSADDDGDETDAPVHDNKKFYITASIVAALVLIAAVVISALAR